MVNPIETILRDFPLIVLDGALATELERRGCDLNDPLWSARVLIDAPDLIRQVHADYFRAGADVATTATYQATFPGFAARGLREDEAADLLRRAVRVAQEARNEFWADPAHRSGRPRPLVAASVGPYGAYLANGAEYTGDYDLSEEDLIAFHRPRLALLAGSGADLIAAETIPSRREARALARLLEEYGVPGWISLSGRDGAQTAHGEPIGEVAAELNQYRQVAAIGVNCTAPRYIAELVRALRAATDKPILAYPNSGEGYDAKRNAWIGRGTADLAGPAAAWHAAGAQGIGGCCRTTPGQIEELAAWARSTEMSRS